MTVLYQACSSFWEEIRPKVNSIAALTQRRNELRPSKIGSDCSVLPALQTGPIFIFGPLQTSNPKHTAAFSS